MSDIYITFGYSIVGLIILIPTIYHFLKKKRSHKDFYFVVISCSAFLLLAFYLFTISVIDIFNFHQGNFSIGEGNCEIHYFEPSARGEGRYDISIDDLLLSANIDNFSYLKEETISCKATYLKATSTVIDIEFK